MNLFQMVLGSMTVLMIAIWAVVISVEVDKLKNKKGGVFVSDKMLSEDEKQKMKDKYYEDMFTKVKNKEPIYITSHGTVLNSKPHTFKDFINNQKLPSKLELIQEILADNDVKIKDIIQKIEDNAPYPPDTLVHREYDALNVNPKQIKMINAIHLDDGNLLPIDNSYPLYIKFDKLNTYTGLLYVVYQAGVTYQAGYRYDDKNIDRGAPTKPTKY